MEEVFRALSDPSRRALLDRLHDSNGQTLVALESALPDMTRFGVMKHLRVLEGAGLVTTRKVGREKHHFLNPVPLARLADRWLDKFTAHAARALLDLRTHLEDPMTVTAVSADATPDASAPTHVFSIVIRTTPEELWKALTESDYTTRYYMGATVESAWEAGSPYRMAWGETDMIVGEVVEADPPRRLVQSFDGRWSPEVTADPVSRVTWEIERNGPVCTLTVIHEGQPDSSPVTAGIKTGWVAILSGLKTLLETGTPLEIPPPAA